MATVAEREAELATLQAAFDEYISSSRELEEELDAELAKMQEKLAESSAANAALSSQLENMAPQLASLETALMDARTKLELEQKLRRQAELVADEAEARARESEGALQSVKEECDAAHEELAFFGSELEETKLELEVERERHRVELEELQEDLRVMESKSSMGAVPVHPADGSQDGGENEKSASFIDENGFPSPDDQPVQPDDDYVKKLEDELELVTEQLIETEQKLTFSEERLTEARAGVENAEKAALSAEDVEKELEDLQRKHEELQEEHHRIKEEMDLNLEELTLTQEELKAAEEDVAGLNEKLDNAAREHRDEVSQMRSELEDAQRDQRTTSAESAALEETLQKSSAECEGLQMQVANLNEALENAKKDQQVLEKELEEVSNRFDSVKAEAERAGWEAAEGEVRAVMNTDHAREVDSYKEKITSLEKANEGLQAQVDSVAMELAEVRDSAAEEKKSVENAESEQVKTLQDQLVRTKVALASKEHDISKLKTALETRVVEAEEQVTRLEKELSATKGQLAEAEAHLIVSKQQARSVSSRNVAKTPSTPPPPPVNSGEDDDNDNVLERSSSMHSVTSPSPRFLRRAKNQRRARSTSPSSNQKLQRKIDEERQKAKEFRKEYDDLKEQHRIGQAKIKQLEKDLNTLRTELFTENAGAAAPMTRLSSIAASPRSAESLFKVTSSDAIDQVLKSGDNEKIVNEFRSMEQKYASQREYNAQLLSKILSLQGNIQVCCRVRPMSVTEIQEGNKSAIEALSETELGAFDSRTHKWKPFAFDKVWSPDQSQQSIFQDVEPLALSVVDGYNACIFAYGQTGSGKTYTMEGVESNGNYGISYRTIQKIFHLLNLRTQQQKAAALLKGGAESSAEFTFKLELGMLEIYNDEVYDLLGSDKPRANADRLDIRKNKSGRVEVPGLAKKSVSSIQDVMRLLKKGNSARATASTNLNEHSSRSHMVLVVDVKSGIEGQPANKGTLYLVDLAGSERVRKSNVEGDQLKEAGFINKSLSALGNVMEALDRKASHVPYRDSKLTYLLQDSLGGNSRTMMVVTVCPMDIAVDESVYALQFATRVRRIQLGAAQRNVTSKNLEEKVKALTGEMKKLAVAKEKSEIQLSSLKKDNARVQDRLQSLSEQRKQSQTENRTLEVLRKTNNEMASRWQKERAQKEKATEELEKAKTELRKKQSEIVKVSRERDNMTRKLQTTEDELTKAAKELRRAQDASSAANLRARKAQIISSRSPRSSKAPASKLGARKESPKSTLGSASASASVASSTRSSPRVKKTAETDVDITKVRGEVLSLLEKYDKGKVDRIDVIMEKFKGKENLLVEKMKQRYEGGGGAMSATSIQKRSELALQRHKERMKQHGAKQ
eukprot:CAMPEP_0194062682 /NCGR_PEP_ID=MMETSP0009_2-20130614/78209_1 /TAXON_ID=210454 /ORGANISM="Grammatophora oceanica, Strain CCMP 410" /LENGTH=1363 /DNA_ID=CAMNT_0038714507 /DNA_START=39 /DNA_END=4130 /DNA_ORIENTATION=-